MDARDGDAGEQRRHVHVQVGADTHEALSRWSSRAARPAGTLVRELIEERLRELGLLAV